MKCDFEHLIYKYYDGQLERGKTIEFSEHLTSCTDCRRRLSMLQKTSNCCRSLDDIATSHYLVNNVMNKIKEKPTARFHWHWAANLAVAAILLVLISNPLIEQFRTTEFRGDDPVIVNENASAQPDDEMETTPVDGAEMMSAEQSDNSVLADEPEVAAEKTPESLAVPEHRQPPAAVPTPVPTTRAARTSSPPPVRASARAATNTRTAAPANTPDSPGSAPITTRYTPKADVVEEEKTTAPPAVSDNTSNAPMKRALPDVQQFGATEDATAKSKAEATGEATTTDGGGVGGIGGNNAPVRMQAKSSAEVGKTCVVINRRYRTAVDKVLGSRVDRNNIANVKTALEHANIKYREEYIEGYADATVIVYE